jgi:meso-butanediol dehydrogenase/(S,S)-butanediol dehydrogenase/diacetyl reductase
MLVGHKAVCMISEAATTLKPALAGLSIVVTGAGKGIGAALARRFAAEGARVTAASLSLPGDVRDEILAAGGTALAVEMDVTDRESVRTGLAAACERFGRIDVMVNNAGISVSSDVVTTTSELWMRHQRVNGLGTLIGMQEAAMLMIELGGGGKIINLTSVAGKRNSADFVAYAASKASVTSLIASGARALASHGITVNGIAPGIVDTPLWSRLDEDADARERRFAFFAAQIPLGRVSTADELGGAAVFLASSASDYMTGEVVTVDGGITA